MIEIDLLKAGKRARSRRPGRLASTWWSLRSLSTDPWIASCAATVAACVVFSLHTLLTARKLRTRWDVPLTNAVLDSTRHAADLARVEQWEMEFSVVGARVDAVEKIDNRRFDWPRIMSEVAGLLPSEAWIVHMARSASEAPTRLLVEGRAWSSQAVAQFQGGLGSSPHLTDVRPIAMGRAKEPAAGAEPGPLFSFVLESDYEGAAQDANEATPSGSAAPQ